MEVKVKDHKTPILTSEQWQKSAMRALMSMYGHTLSTCGYCGCACVDGYVCSCGWDVGYADERDEEGNLVPVYFKR